MYLRHLLGLMGFVPVGTCKYVFACKLCIHANQELADAYLLALTASAMAILCVSVATGRSQVSLPVC